MPEEPSSKIAESEMEFIATYWWMWLLLTAVFGGSAIVGQARRMKKIFTGSAVLEGKSFFAGIGTTMACMVLAWVSGIVFMISMILNIISYAKS